MPLPLGYPHWRVCWRKWRTGRPLPLSGNLRNQPRVVWAVAFACVIAFMGLRLVDPILPGLAKDLHARPSQVELLFSSYILCLLVAMLITSTVSSWLGAKRTLLAG